MYSIFRYELIHVKTLSSASLFITVDGVRRWQAGKQILN